MKKSSSSLLAAAVLSVAFFLPSLQAQPQGGQRDPERLRARAERVAEHLGLTEDQKARLKAVNEAHRAEVEKLRADESLTRKQAREKFAALREDAQQKRNAILTPEQRLKADAMRAKMKDRMQERRGKRGGAEPDGDGF